MKNFAGYEFEEKYEADKVVRLKCTSYCSWDCNFCHMEGNPDSLPIILNENSLNDLIQLAIKFGRNKFHMTGGEPTSYKEIYTLIKFFKDHKFKVAITSNGQFSEKRAKEIVNAGIDSITFSIPTLNIGEFKCMQVKNFSLNRSYTDLNRLLDNIEFFTGQSIETDANVVFTKNIAEREGLINELSNKKITINFLDVIGDLENSGNEIKKYLRNYQLIPLDYKKIIGTSRARYNLLNKEFGNIFSIKVLEPFYLKTMCENCEILKENKCEEGYYCIRVEQQNGSEKLYVRTCIHKNVSCLIENFNQTEIANEILSYKGVYYGKSEI